ncbi:MAG: GTP-binding protein [Oscillospiraceae bacterium]|nr:GTP-binding protein [Oscillospiraceae bacterium]
MTKIDIFSGFLGAGKTTLIRKLIAEAYQGEKLVLIENEFGEIAIDGGFLRDAGVEITEMNSGCICCTLVGDFTKALKKVMDDFAPDRILIEPSGVGKLSDVARAVERVDGAVIGSRVTVVDAGKARMYMRNFGEFFNDQVANADLIVLSRTDVVPAEKVVAASELLRTLNPNAKFITTPLLQLDGAQVREAMEHDALHEEMERLRHEHEHHHHDGEEEHEHHHHHDHGEDECDDPECECHHHHHDHDDDEHEHHHHYDENGVCECGHHHDDDEDEHEHHHHHHHADEIFTSWGHETARRFSEESIRAILAKLGDEEKFGMVLRAKGIVDAVDGEWIYFDYVPGEIDVRRGSPAVTGRFCVIGSKMKEDALKELFGLE